MKSVRKVDFDPTAPSFRSCSDGLNWIGYCKNIDCSIYKQMVVICSGFGEFKLSDEMSKVCCPKCKGSKTLVLRNIGFVKATWNIKGILTLPNG